MMMLGRQGLKIGWRKVLENGLRSIEAGLIHATKVPGEQDDNLNIDTKYLDRKQTFNIRTATGLEKNVVRDIV